MNTKNTKDIEAGCFYKDGVVYQQADGGVVLALSLEAVAARVQANGDESEDGLVGALEPEVVEAIPDGAIDFQDVAFIFSEDALCEIEDAWIAHEERSAAA